MADFTGALVEALLLMLGSEKKSSIYLINPRKLTDEERRALFDNDRDRRMLAAWFAPRRDDKPLQ